MESDKRRGVTQAWCFTCVQCGVAKVLYAEGFDLALKSAEKRARSLGWRFGRPPGWILEGWRCGDCVRGDRYQVEE